MKKILLSAGFALLFYSGIYSQIYLDSGLVAKFYFNGNADDESGFGNNGTVYGATLTEDRFGTHNSAYSFNGIDNYIKVPNSVSLNLQNSFTVCLWIRTANPTSSSLDSTGAYLISKSSYNGSCSFRLSAYERPVPVYDSLCFIYSGDYYDYLSTITRNDLYNDYWKFISFTYDYSFGVLFATLNALDAGSSSFGSQNMVQTTIPLSIGCLWGDANGTTQMAFYKGVIDDIRIYNRGLSEMEVSALYHEGPTGTGNNDIEMTFFDVFPVPANDNLNVSYRSDKNETATIIVSDITGKTVYESIIEVRPENQYISIDVNRFAQGLYSLSIISNGQVTSKKISVIR